MERKRQREIVLGVIAVLLMAVAAYRIKSATAGFSAPPPGARASTAAAQPRASQKNAVTSLDLEALQGARPAPVETERNPFRFKPTPPPAPPPMAVRPQVPVQTGPVEPPPPPRIPLKFIGELNKPGAPKYAIFSDGRGGAPIYGREGEVIEGRYRILRIGVESVELEYLDGRGRQTIRQTGQ